MPRDTRSKPKSKTVPYAKDTPKSSKQNKKSSRPKVSNVAEVHDHSDEVVEIQGQSSVGQSQVQVGLLDNNPNVSVFSELSDLKKSINSMSNLLGSFLTTMSSLVSSDNSDFSKNLATNVDNVQSSVVDQPTSINSLDENIGHGSNEQFVIRQGQPEMADDNQISDNTNNVVIPQVSTPETILQQAVNEHIAAVTDVSHHPPGKRFNIIGRLLDRRVSDKIKKDIWENKYIDLHCLLPQDDKEEIAPILAPGRPGEHAKWQEPKLPKGKLCIDEWCQAFCVYISVYTRKFSESTPGLMAYYNKIQNLASKGGNFLYYDQEFRVAREQEGIPWHIPLLDLWMECLPLQETQSEQTVSIRQPQNYQNSSNFRPSKFSGGSNKKQFHHPKGYCYVFHNTGKCAKGSDCKYSHQCWVPSCQGRHPVFKCYKIKSSSTAQKSGDSSSASASNQTAQNKTPNTNKK